MYVKAGRGREGIDFISKHLKAEPGNGDLWVARAFLHLKEDAREGGIADLTQGLERGAHHDGWPFAERAEHRTEKGQWSAARDDFAAALALQPLNHNWLVRHAWTLHALDDTEAVKEALGPAGTVRKGAFLPGSADAVEAARVGSVTAKGKFPSQVITSMNKAAKDRPQDAARHTTHALVFYRFYRGKRFKEAALKAALTAHGKGGTPVDWLTLAMVHHQLKKPDEAKRWLADAEKWFALPEAERRNALGQPLTWIDRLELDLLHAEAKQLLQGTKKVVGKTK